MTSKYTVVQYVPDAIADERINFGVITWDKKRVCSRFIADWRPIRSFGGQDIRFIREFANRIAELTSPQISLPEITEDDKLDRRRLEKIVGEWSYSIQFTDPRGSLKDAQALLDEAASIFLRQSAPKTRRGRSRRSAASLAYKFMLEAVEQRVPGEAEDFLKTNEILEGKLDKHRFDVVLANGKLLAAVYALSFEISESEHLGKEVDVTAWTIDDVRKRYRQLPMAVYVLPPLTEEGSSSYDRAIRVFQGLSAEVVTDERMMGVWARARAQSLAV